MRPRTEPAGSRGREICGPPSGQVLVISLSREQGARTTADRLARQLETYGDCLQVTQTHCEDEPLVSRCWVF